MKSIHFSPRELAATPEAPASSASESFVQPTARSKKKAAKVTLVWGHFNFPCGGLGDQDFHTVLVWSFEANDG